MSVFVPNVNPEVGEFVDLGTLEIMGQTWTVVGYKATHDYTRGTANLGNCQTGINRIGLCISSPDGEPLPASSIAATLMHELIHIMAEYVGIELSETQVEAFANVQYQVFSANPGGFIEFEASHAEPE